MTTPLHLNGLRALEASIRLGSFTRAAGELGVTPAAVGQHVRNLEAALGLKLLHRRPNGFEPTRAALEAQESLARGFNQLREGLDRLSQRQPPARISLSVVPTFGNHWLTPRLAGFRAAHPDADLRIDATHQVYDPPLTQSEFVLRYAAPGDSGKRDIPLFREVLLPVCTPAVAEGLPPSPRSLAAAPLIHVESETTDRDWCDWPAWSARFGIAIPNSDRGLRFTRTTLALPAMYAGNGLLLAQLSIVLPDILAGRLVAPFGADYCVTSGYYYRLVVFKQAPVSPQQRAFLAWLQAEAAATEAAMRDFTGAPVPA